jgi:TatD DNase family protein
MQIFDSHCHLEDTSYDKDRPQVLQRAAAAGIEAVMIAGINLARAQKALIIADQAEGVYVSVGVHPHDCGKCTESTLIALAELADHPLVRAWGEIGLDFNRMYSPHQDQERWFVTQLRLAQQLKLPLIFHERDSQGRFYDLLQANLSGPIEGVVHCFSGNAQDLSRYLEMGLHIGITGILTMQKRGAQLRQLVQNIPLERLLIETDAPYLTPAPHKNRTRRNEPAFVAAVLYQLAEVRNIPVEKLAPILWHNTCRLYRIKADDSLGV